MKSPQIKIGFPLIVSILAAVLWGPSCNESSQLPPYVMSEQQMIVVLADMQLIEGALNQQQYGSKDVFKLLHIYYDSLFVKYGIERYMIDSSLVYYSRYPEKLDKIYEEVINILSRVELNPVSDSIKVSDP